MCIDCEVYRAPVHVCQCVQMTFPTLSDDKTRVCVNVLPECTGGGVVSIVFPADRASYRIPIACGCGKALGFHPEWFDDPITPVQLSVYRNCGASTFAM